MSGPLIPYIPGQEMEIPLSFLEYIPLLGDLIDKARPPSIKPFGTLVALGVYLGSVVTMNRARERNLNTQLMSDFIFWTVATGFVLSHMLDAIFYHPQTVLRDPLYLLRIWDGLSSYGGFIGALVGAHAWRFYRKKPIMEYVDVTASAFPLAWVFGRMGCSVVHDHPGALSNAWFAVRYPPHLLREGFDGRYDLGLYEMILTIPLAYACHWLWKRKPRRPAGFYVGFTLTLYAPVRFVLDALRVSPDERILAADPRYFGLTPAQWACFLALATGLYFLRKTYGQPYVRIGELEPPEEGDEDEDGDEDALEDSDEPARSASPDPANKAKSKKPSGPKSVAEEQLQTDGEEARSAEDGGSEHVPEPSGG